MRKLDLARRRQSRPLRPKGLVLALMTALASAPASGHGRVDQWYRTFGSGESYSILPTMAIGQEFIPSRSPLLGVDLSLVGGTRSDTVTVNIRKGQIAAPILATASREVPPCPAAPPSECRWVHFDLLPRLTVVPGEVYVLEVTASRAEHAWQGDRDHYPRGAAILQGAVDTEVDLGFQTYWVTCDCTLADVICGTDGDDYLTGSEGPEVLCGFRGDDVLDGLGGDDHLFGGRGEDILFGGRGDDQLFGEENPDLLYGEAGWDLLEGGGGSDLLNGGRGNDRLEGGYEDDILLGRQGHDLIRGGFGADLLKGGEGYDQIWGGGDNDLLIGGNGHDILMGGSGNDELRGSPGSDVCRGGSGRDTYVNCECEVDEGELCTVIVRECVPGRLTNQGGCADSFRCVLGDYPEASQGQSRCLSLDECQFSLTRFNTPVCLGCRGNEVGFDSDADGFLDSCR